MKTCSKCGKSHPEDFYYKDKGYATGVKPMCKACSRAANKKWSIKSKYGITPEEYREMLLFQNGVCAICQKPETAMRNGSFKDLAIDHNHSTGKVRGLLCSRCNMGIGYLMDNAENLRRAADYCEMSGEEQ